MPLSDALIRAYQQVFALILAEPINVPALEEARNALIHAQGGDITCLLKSEQVPLTETCIGIPCRNSNKQETLMNYLCITAEIETSSDVIEVGYHPMLLVDSIILAETRTLTMAQKQNQLQQLLDRGPWHTTLLAVMLQYPNAPLQAAIFATLLARGEKSGWLVSHTRCAGTEEILHAFAARVTITPPPASLHWLMEAVEMLVAATPTFTYSHAIDHFLMYNQGLLTEYMVIAVLRQERSKGIKRDTTSLLTISKMRGYSTLLQFVSQEYSRTEPAPFDIELLFTLATSEKTADIDYNALLTSFVSLKSTDASIPLLDNALIHLNCFRQVNTFNMNHHSEMSTFNAMEKKRGRNNIKTIVTFIKNIFPYSEVTENASSRKNFDYQVEPVLLGQIATLKHKLHHCHPEQLKHLAQSDFLTLQAMLQCSAVYPFSIDFRAADAMWNRSMDVDEILMMRLQLIYQWLNVNPHATAFNTFYELMELLEEEPVNENAVADLIHHVYSTIPPHLQGKFLRTLTHLPHPQVFRVIIPLMGNLSFIFHEILLEIASNASKILAGENSFLAYLLPESARTIFKGKGYLETQLLIRAGLLYAKRCAALHNEPIVPWLHRLYAALLPLASRWNELAVTQDLFRSALDDTLLVHFFCYPMQGEANQPLENRALSWHNIMECIKQRGLPIDRLRTAEGNTVLHLTAQWNNPDAFSAFYYEYPKLITVRNKSNQLPSESCQHPPAFVKDIEVPYPSYARSKILVLRNCVDRMLSVFNEEAKIRMHADFYQQLSQLKYAFSIILAEFPICPIHQAIRHLIDNIKTYLRSQGSRLEYNIHLNSDQLARQYAALCQTLINVYHLLKEPQDMAWLTEPTALLNDFGMPFEGDAKDIAALETLPAEYVMNGALESIANLKRRYWKNNTFLKMILMAWSPTDIEQFLKVHTAELELRSVVWIPERTWISIPEFIHYQLMQVIAHKFCKLIEPPSHVTLMIGINGGINTQLADPSIEPLKIEETRLTETRRLNPDSIMDFRETRVIIFQAIAHHLYTLQQRLTDYEPLQLPHIQALLQNTLHQCSKIPVFAQVKMQRSAFSSYVALTRRLTADKMQMEGRAHLIWLLKIKLLIEWLQKDASAVHRCCELLNSHTHAEKQEQIIQEYNATLGTPAGKQVFLLMLAAYPDPILFRIIDKFTCTLTPPRKADSLIIQKTFSEATQGFPVTPEIFDRFIHQILLYLAQKRLLAGHLTPLSPDSYINYLIVFSYDRDILKQLVQRCASVGPSLVSKRFNIGQTTNNTALHLAAASDNGISYKELQKQFPQLTRIQNSRNQLPSQWTTPDASLRAQITEIEENFHETPSLK